MEDRILEKDIIIPALEEVMKKPNITTSELIVKLEARFTLYPKDKEILTGRSDNHFSQIVRNLCGSNAPSNIFGQCVTINKTSKTNSFVLNENGYKILKEKNVMEMMELLADEEYQQSIKNAKGYTDKNKLMIQSNRKPKLKTTPEGLKYVTDSNIAKTVLKNKKYICENSILLHESHKTFQTPNGYQYQEAHHLIPMKAQKDFVDVNIDRPENIICLCPICHRAIHLAKKKDKIKILKRLYNCRIHDLKTVGINITFEDLYNKYYS